MRINKIRETKKCSVFLRLSCFIKPQAILPFLIYFDTFTFNDMSTHSIWLPFPPALKKQNKTKQNKNKQKNCQKTSVTS